MSEPTQEQLQAYLELQGRKAEVEALARLLANRQIDLAVAEKGIMASMAEKKEDPQPEAKKKSHLSIPDIGESDAQSY